MEKEVKVEKKETTKKTAPKKNTAVKTKIDPKTGTLKVVEKKTTSKKTTGTSTAKKVAPAKKKTTTAATKKPATTKKATTPKKAASSSKKIVVEPVKQEPVIITTSPVIEEIENNEQHIEETQVLENQIVEHEIITPKKRGRKPSENPLPKLSSKELTIEPPKREPKVEPKKEEKKPTEPEVIVRPTPKKPKNFTKEEKVLYKKLQDAFNYVANFTNVIEERTMDLKQIPDLTVGELHVIEMVDQNNNKPMTLIAKKMKVTVGSLTIAINRLVQKGYLLRTRHEMDHRVILVSITPKGKKVLKSHDQFHENILGLVLDSLTLKQTLTVMNQFAMVLENYYDPKTIVGATKKKGSN